VDGQVFLPFPTSRDRVRDSTHVRSTWLSSSLIALRERGRFDSYLVALPRQYHAPVLESVAGVWLTMDVAIAHYRACDALGLSPREMREIGLEVTQKVHGTSLALAIRLAKQAGVTPWTILAQLQRLWDRTWQGGGVEIQKQGPKEAIIEVLGWPIASIPYVRQTMPAVALGVCGMFCAKAYVTDVPKLASERSLGMKLQWA
jgi:hypothetical protein